MDTRLIFLDIDGTFIEPGRMEAPASAVEAVRAAQADQQGGLVVRAAGMGLLPFL